MKVSYLHIFPIFFHRFKLLADKSGLSSISMHCKLSVKHLSCVWVVNLPAAQNRPSSMVSVLLIFRLVQLLLYSMV